jgi:hypothetical protein
MPPNMLARFAAPGYVSGAIGAPESRAITAAVASPRRRSLAGEPLSEGFLDQPTRGQLPDRRQRADVLGHGVGHADAPVDGQIARDLCDR